MDSESKLTERQQQFIQAFDACGGNISVACKKANIKSRNTYYVWMENPAFKEEIEAINESFIDLAETQLRMAVGRGDMNAVFFILKTKGKSRGYVERSEVNANVHTNDSMTREQIMEELHRLEELNNDD